MGNSITSIAARKSLRQSLWGVIILAGFGLLQGCATGASPFNENVPMTGFLLRVESRHNAEVSVYANPGGGRELLGTVPANGLEFLEFQYPAGQPLAIELETRLGDRYRMQPAHFPGGGRVDLLISGTLNRSGFVRRGPGS